MSSDPRFQSIDGLVAHIGDGARLAVPKDPAGAPMEAVRALIRSGVKDIHLITVPTNGWATEWLVGAGAVKRVETSGVSLGEFGGAPRFNEAVNTGAVEVRDATCPAIYAALQAGEKGIPFIPLRGVIGSDVLGHRGDWKVMDNPFSDDSDPVLLLPAIRPEVALFHARRADRNGNVFVGVQGELAIMAHAAERTFVTVEEVVDGDSHGPRRRPRRARSRRFTSPASPRRPRAPGRSGFWTCIRQTSPIWPSMRKWRALRKALPSTPRANSPAPANLWRPDPALWTASAKNS